MVFNWFRRQFTDTSKSAEKSEESPASAETSPAEAPETETTSATSQAEDEYLQWAKAAYRNIQARQGVEPSTTTETEPETTTEPTEEEETAPETETTTTSPAATESPTPTSSEAATTVESESETPPEPPSEPKTPIWAETESQRQARMERLKAEAVEAPEPEIPETEETETPSANEPLTLQDIYGDINLDEGFLWSARLLAQQGRNPDDVSIEEITWLQKLRRGLEKTRRNLINQLKSIVGQGPLNEEAIMEIEALLLGADVGVEATDRIIDALQEKLREEALPPEAAINYLKTILREILDRPTLDRPTPLLYPEKDQLNIWLITGVNGSGKTTTIGKLAHIAQKSGYKCLIAAADTFRAAAIEQVKIWGQRSQVDVIANPTSNTDPASVVFDAINAARSRETELLLVDTAGRLQNKKNLMEELNKVRRVIDKKADDAKVESLLVLDATLGQNGLQQAQVFAEAAHLSGIVLTKLDGTAKGGIAFSVVEQLGLPIRFIGAGEGIEDLRPFSSYEFVEAMLSG
ncbi:signal recognition particle-docking protein FtsY [Geitlerinema sp. PCC 9228]|jgi:fused signal recognition particle receptor|uniref:signal recognition particle-docking protein FtsY n=1 Tax=Geitlerinema sp. PCC 9228 TaxID=111611 RepID=UPI0008F9DEC0|nr:signal recognition particle-docking protein FtsY [Geitlerinema sp. PCC 9228]